MQFDDTEELREPKLCCYRKRWIASRALIWSFVSVGACLFSIGYVLKVFTAHYPDDKDTASMFEISGVTLVSVGASLTGLGIIACFHSCCVVLCYRPANTDKPAKGSTSSQPNDPDAVPSALPSVVNLPRHNTSSELQRPLLSNGYYSVSPNNAGNSSPLAPPQRSATSPRFFPPDKDDTIPLWNDLPDADRRRHQSQGNIRQNDWGSDSEPPRYPVLVDKTPAVGKEAHPYSDDYLHQKLRKKMTSTSEMTPEVEVKSRGSTKSSSGGGPYATTELARKDSARIRAKPLFKVGGPSMETRDSGQDSVWEHRNNSHVNNNEVMDQPITSAMPSASPHIGRSSSSVRHRQYFHEEHFAFTDFEPDDAFLPPNTEPSPLTQRAEFTSYNDDEMVNEPIIRPSTNRSPLLSRSYKGDSVRQHQHHSQYVDALSSPKPCIIIPPVSNNASLPVSKPAVVHQHHHSHHRSHHHQQNVGAVIDGDSNTSLPYVAQLSAGSTTSGRGSVNSRGYVDLNSQEVHHHSLPITVAGLPPLPTSSTSVSVSMPSPLMGKRASPIMSPKRPPSSTGSRRSHEPTPEYSGPDSSSKVQPNIEMTDFAKTPNGRIKLSPARSVPHRPSSSQPQDIIYSTSQIRSAVIRGQISQSRRYGIGSALDDNDADIDNISSPDPEEAFPIPNKSPRHERAMMASFQRNPRSSPSFAASSTASDRPIMSAAMMATRRSSPNVISSALTSHLPAQDPYIATQAFLCDNEEII